MKRFGIYELHQGLVGTFETREDAEAELEDMFDTKGEHLRENYRVIEMIPKGLENLLKGVI